MNKHIFAEPHYEGHPWLLLEDVTDALLKTPMGINKLRLLANGASSAYGAAVSNGQRKALFFSSAYKRSQNSRLRAHVKLRLKFPLLTLTTAVAILDDLSATTVLPAA